MFTAQKRNKTPGHIWAILTQRIYCLKSSKKTSILESPDFYYPLKLEDLPYNWVKPVLEAILIFQYAYAPIPSRPLR